MNRFYRFISIILEIAAILCFTFVGWRILDHVARLYETSFHSLSLLVCVGLALFLQAPIHELGYLLGGLFTGRKLIAFRFFGRNYVRENGRFCVRERLPEQELIPVVMAGKKEESSVSLTLYFLGGVIAHLIVVLICYLLLRTRVISCHSTGGSIMFALFITGIWSITDSLIPIYRMGQPNDALKLIRLLVNSDDRDLFCKDLRWIDTMSEGGVEERALILSDLRDDVLMDGPVSVFRACFLLRAYEALIWEKEYEKASELLKVLYLVRKDLPEKWYDMILSEVVSCLCLLGEQEPLDVTDMMMNDTLKARMEQSGEYQESRSLYLWSLHHVELKKAQERYYKKTVEMLKDVPFAFAREGWMGTTIHG